MEFPPYDEYEPIPCENPTCTSEASYFIVGRDRVTARCYSHAIDALRDVTFYVQMMILTPRWMVKEVQPRIRSFNP